MPVVGVEVEVTGGLAGGAHSVHDDKCGHERAATTA